MAIGVDDALLVAEMAVMVGQLATDLANEGKVSPERWKAIRRRLDDAEVAWEAAGKAQS